MSHLPKSIPAFFFKAAQAFPDRQLYSQFLRQDSHSESFTLIERNYSEVAARVNKIALYLREVGVKQGNAVGIISATRPEWLEADMAIMSVGGISVSLYPSLTESEIAYILFDSGAKVLFVENIEQLQKVLNVLDRVNLIPASDDRPVTKARIVLEKIISFENVEESSKAISFNSLLTNDPKQATAITFNATFFEGQESESLATIVYTSGTTGPQKGVMQTHGNHLANVRQALSGGLYRKDSSIFMLLPLAHSFSRLMGYIGFVQGVPLQFPSIADATTSKANQRRTLTDLSQSQCSVIPLVPRILEKMKEGICAQAQKNNLRGRLIQLTLKACSGNNRSKTSLFMKIAYCLTSFMRRKIRTKLFGSNFEYVISGGAKLDPSVNRFFAGLEIEVLEGYGLTETCVATNCNRPGKNRIGSVGPVLNPDIEIKLSEDGEILFRGPNVAKGYYNQPTATKKSWDAEGWFHTGDLGSLSPDGFLSITGRKKEIVVTAGGKKISPERIEQMLKTDALLSQALLVGDGRPYCVAILTLIAEASIQVKGPSSTAQFIKRIENHLDFVNSQLASFETVKKVIFVNMDFTSENGFLTPTLKMRRSLILKSYQDQIDRLYQSNDRVLFEE